MGVGQLSESDAVDALRLPFYSSSHPTGSHGWRNQFDLGNPEWSVPHRRHALRLRLIHRPEALRESIALGHPFPARKFEEESEIHQHPFRLIRAQRRPVWVAPCAPRWYVNLLLRQGAKPSVEPSSPSLLGLARIYYPNSLFQVKPIIKC